MTRYYTYTPFLSESESIPRKGYNFFRSFGKAPAVLFFVDDDELLVFEDVLPALREMFPGGPVPVQYRLLSVGGTYSGVVVTPSLELPGPAAVKTFAGGEDRAAMTWVDDIHAQVPRAQEIAAGRIYRESCTDLEGMMGHCPCTKSTERVEAYTGPYACAATYLAPKIDVVPLERLLRTQGHGVSLSLLEDRKTYGGFEYVSGRYLTDEPFAGRHQGLRKIDPSCIAEQKKAYKERAKDASETLKLRRQKCTPCIFRGGKETSACASSNAVRSCSGPKTEEHVRAAVARGIELAEFYLPGFTDEQRDILIHNSGVELKASISAFSSRPTTVVLGRFAQKHAQRPWVFQVFAGCSDKSKHVAYDRWEDLVAAIPEVKDLVVPAYRPNIERWMLDAYVILARYATFVTFRSMRGYSQRDLMQIKVTHTSVDGYYGNAYGVSHWHSRSLGRDDYLTQFNYIWGKDEYWRAERMATRFKER